MPPTFAVFAGEAVLARAVVGSALVPARAPVRARVDRAQRKHLRKRTQSEGHEHSARNMCAASTMGNDLLGAAVTFISFRYT